MHSWSSPDVPRLDGDEAGGSPLFVRDSASGDLVDIGAGREQILMYVCGITPYDATHLGHAATYLLFDTLQRTARDTGRTVRYVQNVTDIDDPLLERAAETGEDWTALAERETELFRSDMAALRVLAPDAYIGAVEAMPDVVEAVVSLRDKGSAYDLEGDTYFSVATSPGFGGVSGLPVADMVTLSGERGGDPGRIGKKDPLDCLLWQAARPGEPAWPSALGRGRPGWHIECAAIALKHLGPTIDVQGGGEDLVFPHHELSAAEAEVLTGQAPFARAFVHQAMVGYDGEKMSKSRGNLVLVSRLRQHGVDPMAIRVALLGHRHDVAWEWHDEELEVATARLDRWRAAFGRSSAAPAATLVAALRRALRSGLDTPSALAAVDEWVAADGGDESAPRTARLAVDALLGIV